MRATANPKIKQYRDKASGKPRYLVRYRKADGRQTMKRGFTTKRDAEQWLTGVETAKLRGEFVPVSAGRTRLGTLADGWLASKQVRVKPSHYESLVSSWRVHVEPRWGDSPVGAITAGDVQAWVAGLASERSATVVIRAHGVLAGVLDDAVRDRLIVTNPARGVTLPRKARKPSRYLTHEQVGALAEASGRPLLIYTLAYCGLRWGEATALQVRDVNLLRRRIKVERAVSIVPRRGFIVGTTKGHESRTVPIPMFLADMLAARISDAGSPDDLVFPAVKAEFLRQPTKSRIVEGRRVGVKWWERALDECGLPWMTPHDLRHTTASLAVQAGASVKAVQRMLGHKSAAITLDIYADLFDSDLDDVAVRMGAARAHVLNTDMRDGPGIRGQLRGV